MQDKKQFDVDLAFFSKSLMRSDLKAGISFTLTQNVLKEWENEKNLESFWEIS